MNLPVNAERHSSNKQWLRQRKADNPPIVAEAAIEVPTEAPTQAALIPTTFIAGYKPQANLPIKGDIIFSANQIFSGALTMRLVNVKDKSLRRIQDR
ncbi:MAG: hypothetical protein QME21_09255 [Anaerolineales bacterium]|nr:hypothetical protein [Anaerolineales bacterium]